MYICQTSYSMSTRTISTGIVVTIHRRNQSLVLPTPVDILQAAVVPSGIIGIMAKSKDKQCKAADNAAADFAMQLKKASICA